MPSSLGVPRLGHWVDVGHHRQGRLSASEIAEELVFVLTDNWQDLGLRVASASFLASSARLMWPPSSPWSTFGSARVSGAVFVRGGRPRFLSSARAPREAKSTHTDASMCFPQSGWGDLN